MVALDDWTGGDQDSRLLSFTQGDLLVAASLDRLTCCLTRPSHLLPHSTVSLAASLHRLTCCLTPLSHLLPHSTISLTLAHSLTCWCDEKSGVN